MYPNTLLLILNLMFHLSPGRKHAIDEEMRVYHENQTWELPSLPPRKHTVGCRYVYTVKHLPYGSVESFKHD